MPRSPAPSPKPGPSPSPPPSGHGPKVTPQSWAVSFLTAIGAPATKANVDSVVSWEAMEGGNWRNTARFNPLNTTQTEPGSTSMNSVGVQSYQSWSDGLAATVTTIQNGAYADVLAALRSGKGLFGAQYRGLSTWSGGGYSSISSHTGYGGGAGASVGQQASGGADPSTCLVAWPSAHISLFFGLGPTVGGGCIFSKSQARAVAGGFFLLAGAFTFLAGAALLVTATAVTVAGPAAAALGAGRPVAALFTRRRPAEDEDAGEGEGGEAEAGG